MSERDDFPSDFTPAMREAATQLLAQLEAMSLDHRKYTLALLRQKYPPPSPDKTQEDGK